MYNKTSLFIYVRNTNQESKKTLEAVQKYVDPTALEVGINEIRTVREGGVVIKCKNKEEINKIKIVAEKKLGKSYKVNTPDLKNPNIKILDINRELTADELIEAIKNQNAFLNYESVLLNVKVIKKMKTKWMAIAECDAVSFNKIIKENGLLFLDWSRCRVFEYISVFRCYKCGGFDHKADQCTNNSSRCLRWAKAVREHKNESK